jgi:hypothetical protein
MVQPSSDFKERANKILDVVAAGNFFQENHPKLLPTFDRWNTNKKGECGCVDNMTDWKNSSHSI